MEEEVDLKKVGGKLRQMDGLFWMKFFRMAFRMWLVMVVATLLPFLYFIWVKLTTNNYVSVLPNVVTLIYLIKSFVGFKRQMDQNVVDLDDVKLGEVGDVTIVNSWGVFIRRVVVLFVVYFPTVILRPEKLSSEQEYLTNFVDMVLFMLLLFMLFSQFVFERSRSFWSVGVKSRRRLLDNKIDVGNNELEG